ncbi:MAG: hypothetical protein V4584_03760 [Verrucomicrobiota bacterium]
MPPEPETHTTVILLSSCAGLLVLIVFLIFRISRRLSRIESLISRNNSRPETSEQAPSVAETSPGGAFEAFLSEDPARRGLTKGEQFAAYRLWRHEKGMNWSNS